MDWKIIDSLADPNTGSYFSVVQGSKNLKLILWCRGDYFLRQNSKLSTGEQGLYVNDQLRNISVLHVLPYNVRLWQTLIKKTDCPGNTNKSLVCCPVNKKCLLKPCPYIPQKHLATG
ncbi:TPA: anti-adapter protein iraM [Citrobacter freundii]